ncbi:Na+/serine symporter [Paenibacillus popilliae ATCC 14706]|uniref:Na+/serine symporter n=1 Tax=Paenibacillus popilliae ATCC 14706 TaxID=1212764 RepID=M9LGN6_PAEPP|nr:Na+/serine symporter [Paenibacillus popilliae ATCC 14706]
MFKSLTLKLILSYFVMILIPISFIVGIVQKPLQTAIHSAYSFILTYMERYI